MTEPWTIRKWGPYPDRPAWIVDNETGCWRWNGRFRPNGYGSTHVANLPAYAHRVVYERIVGPIPDGLVIDHLCGQKDCVNPDHLEPVTQWANCMRGTSPAAICAQKTHCQHGHPFDDENTYRRPHGGRECRTCMRAKDRARYPQRAARRKALAHA